MSTQIAAPGDVSGGDVFEGANGIGVYADDALTGEQVSVITFAEVELTKETGVAFTFLQQLYWDATNDRLDATATNIPAGLASAPAASADTVARVFLNLGSGDS